MFFFNSQDDEEVKREARILKLFHNAHVVDYKWTFHIFLNDTLRWTSM